MNFNKKLIKFSAISVYLGMIIFFFVVLLSDVKLSTNAFLNALNLSNFIDKNNFIPLITVTGTIFAYFSIVILSFGDFSRYVKDEFFCKLALKNWPKKHNQSKNLLLVLC